MNYLSEIVYGGTDGIITTYAIIASSIGIQLNPYAIVVIGLASLIADAFSMATSSYLSEEARMNKKHSINVAIVTFVSFVFFGGIILLPYFYSFYNPTYTPTFNVFVILSSIILAIIGLLRGYKKPIGKKVISVIETVSIGLIASIISYVIAKQMETYYSKNNIEL